MRQEDTTVTVRIAAGTVAVVDRLAEQEHRTRSAMIRLLLTEAVETRQKR